MTEQRKKREKTIELISQTKIAELAGVSKAAVTKWRKRDSKHAHPFIEWSGGTSSRPLYDKERVTEWLQKEGVAVKRIDDETLIRNFWGWNTIPEMDTPWIRSFLICLLCLVKMSLNDDFVAKLYSKACKLLKQRIDRCGDDSDFDILQSASNDSSVNLSVKKIVKLSKEYPWVIELWESDVDYLDDNDCYDMPKIMSIVFDQKNALPIDARKVMKKIQREFLEELESSPSRAKQELVDYWGFPCFDSAYYLPDFWISPMGVLDLLQRAHKNPDFIMWAQLVLERTDFDDIETFVQLIAECKPKTVYGQSIYDNDILRKLTSKLPNIKASYNNNAFFVESGDYDCGSDEYYSTLAKQLAFLLEIPAEKTDYDVRGCSTVVSSQTKSSKATDSPIKADVVFYSGNYWSQGLADIAPDDPRWIFGVPSAETADFIWIQDAIYHLRDENSRAFVKITNPHVLIANEAQGMRKNLVMNGYVETMIMNKNDYICVLKLPDDVGNDLTMFGRMGFPLNDTFLTAVGEVSNDHGLGSFYLQNKVWEKTLAGTLNSNSSNCLPMYLDAFCDTFCKKHKIPFIHGTAKQVSIDAIQKADYKLTPWLYKYNDTEKWQVGSEFVLAFLKEQVSLFDCITPISLNNRIDQDARALTIKELIDSGKVTMRAGCATTDDESQYDGIVVPEDINTQSLDLTAEGFEGYTLVHKKKGQADVPQEKLSKQGDILIATTGKLAAIIDNYGGHLISSRITVVRIESKDIFPEYLAICLNGKNNQKIFSGTTLRKSAVEGLTVPMIFSADQTAIIQSYSSMKKIAAVAREVEVASQLYCDLLDDVLPKPINGQSVDQSIE